MTSTPAPVHYLYGNLFYGNAIAWCTVGTPAGASRNGAILTHDRAEVTCTACLDDIAVVLDGVTA